MFNLHSRWGGSLARQTRRHSYGTCTCFSNQPHEPTTATEHRYPRIFKAGRVYYKEHLHLYLCLNQEPVTGKCLKEHSPSQAMDLS